MKESEDAKKRHDKEHEDDDMALPDMKDVLLQMRLADNDNELLITEDEDDKKHGHGKKAKK